MNRRRFHFTGILDGRRAAKYWDIFLHILWIGLCISWSKNDVYFIRYVCVRRQQTDSGSDTPDGSVDNNSTCPDEVPSEYWYTWDCLKC